MRQQLRVITLLISVAVALAACSSSGTRGRSTTPPTRAQLEAALLTVTDVGSTWKAGAAINAADLASVAQSIPCDTGALDPAVAKRLTAVTGIQFEPVDRSYKHLIELTVTGAPAQLNGDLKALFAALDSCAATTSAAPGGKGLSAERFSIPQLGDQRAAYLITDLESAGSPRTWYVRNAAVRIGPVAIVLGLTEILGTRQGTPQIGDDTFGNSCARQSTNSGCE